jgi:hypothetical protein
MDDVAQEVQRFLTEQVRGQVIYTFSGDKEIRIKVPAMLKERAKASAIDAIRDVFTPVGIDPTAVLAISSSRRRVSRRTAVPAQAPSST